MTGLWPECAATDTKLENIMVNPQKEKCAHEKFYRKIPDYAKYLRTFGEIGIGSGIATVKIKTGKSRKYVHFLRFCKKYYWR